MRRLARAFTSSLIPIAFVAALLAAPSAWAAPHAAAPGLQDPAPQDPLQRLQQLTAAQQAALDSGDPGQIVTTGRQLASLAQSLLANLYAGEGNADAAAQALTRAWELAPEPGTGLSLITSSLERNRPQEASHVEQQLLQAAGESARLRLLLASAHHAADDLPGTITELTRAISLNPQFAPAHLALGNAFWELNEYQYNADSLREFTEAQHLDPAGYLANFNLGSILSEYQRFGEAAPFLEFAASADPASPDPWLQLGMNAYAQNRVPDALAALEKSVTLTGVDQARNSYQIRRVYAVLSRLHAEAGHSEQARRMAVRAEDLHAEILRSNIASPLSESTGLVVNNSSAKARSVSTAAIPSPPSAPPTPQQQQLERQLQQVVANSLNDAGTALARGHDYAGALPLFRQASAADPTLAAATRNLGLAAFHVGGYDEAVTALTRALEQNPADALARQDLEQSLTLRKAQPAPSRPPGKP